MASDMVAAARCLRVVAWLNSDFELLLKLLEAWAEEIERELDFRVCPWFVVCLDIVMFVYIHHSPPIYAHKQKHDDRWKPPTSTGCARIW